MERTLRGTSATISVTFYVDGVATDPGPDAATVEVLRDAGTQLVAPTPATEAGPGKFTFALTPIHQAQLDLLKARWTATVAGQPQTVETEIEVVGGFHFSLAFARKLSPLDDDAAYPTPDLVEARTMAEQALEDECGVAFVPRYAKETLYGDGGRILRLGRVRVTKLQSVLVDGTALTSQELAALRLGSLGRITRDTGWTRGARIDVFYEHGSPRAPSRVARASRLLAKSWLVERIHDERATVIESEGGGRTVFASARDQPFDLPEVNAVVRDFGVKDLPVLR